VHRLAVRDIEPVKREAARFPQDREPRLLQPDDLIGVEIVDTDHAIAAREQRPGDVVADETRNTCHQDGHATLLPRYRTLE
jgi:hypothetical protein